MGKTAWTKRSTVEAVLGSMGGVPLDAASAMLRRQRGRLEPTHAAKEAGL